MSIQSNLKINNKIIEISFYEHGSASGTGSPGSRNPSSGNLGPVPELGLILKSGTGTGTQIKKIRDWDRDSDLRDEGLRDSDLRDSTLGDCPGDRKFSGTWSRSRADPCLRKRIFTNHFVYDQDVFKWYK